jgi:polyphenol oxidase
MPHDRPAEAGPYPRPAEAGPYRRPTEAEPVPRPAEAGPAGAGTYPAVPDAFYWSTESWGVALRCRALDRVAAHLFTTRQLELTDPADLDRLAVAVGARRVAMVTQVHKADVVVIRKGEAPPLLAVRRPGAQPTGPDADVIVTNDADVAIAVRAADCVPILIADHVTGAVAAVHAGWRGTAARAVHAAVDALARGFGSNPRDLVAAIGPSIGSCCYEVGPELVDAFAAAGHERYLIQRWFTSLPPRKGESGRSPLHLDVAGANRDQLVLAGMREDQVFLSGLCTAEHLNVFTSFRMEKEKAGRIAGVIRPLD